MQCFQYSLILQVIVPGILVFHDGWQANVQLQDDCVAETMIQFWAGIVIDLCSQIDNSQRIVNEGNAVNDCLGDFLLD